MEGEAIVVFGLSPKFIFHVSINDAGTVGEFRSKGYEVRVGEVENFLRNIEVKFRFDDANRFRRSEPGEKHDQEGREETEFGFHRAKGGGVNKAEERVTCQVYTYFTKKSMNIYPLFTPNPHYLTAAGLIILVLVEFVLVEETVPKSATSPTYLLLSQA